MAAKNPPNYAADESGMSALYQHFGESSDFNILEWCRSPENLRFIEPGLEDLAKRCQSGDIDGHIDSIYNGEIAEHIGWLMLMPDVRRGVEVLSEFKPVFFGKYVPAIDDEIERSTNIYYIIWQSPHVSHIDRIRNPDASVGFHGMTLYLRKPTVVTPDMANLPEFNTELIYNGSDCFSGAGNVEIIKSKEFQLWLSQQFVGDGEENPLIMPGFYPKNAM